MKDKSLLLIAMLATLTLCACSNQVSINPAHMTVASKEVSETPGTVIFPDDKPSIADGKAVFEKMNCAQCHGTRGELPVPVTRAVAHCAAEINHGAFTFALKDHTWANRQQPVREYEFLTFGKPGVNHPVLKDKLSVSERWDLVFYVRSLATPFITETQWAQVDPVWGSNCAVCHGKRGNGDGPLTKGMVLQPVPANFQSFPRFYARSDDDIYLHIANGIPWEGMPNFLGKYDHSKNVHFDPPYIRKLVQYVRAFHSTDAPTATP